MPTMMNIYRLAELCSPDVSIKMMRMLKTVANVSSPLIIGISFRNEDVVALDAGSGAGFFGGLPAFAGYKLMQIVGIVFDGP